MKWGALSQLIALVSLSASIITLLTIYGKQELDTDIYYEISSSNNVTNTDVIIKNGHYVVASNILIVLASTMTIKFVIDNMTSDEPIVISWSYGLYLTIIGIISFISSVLSIIAFSSNCYHETSNRCFNAATPLYTVIIIHAFAFAIIYIIYIIHSIMYIIKAFNKKNNSSTIIPM